jgi:hypothetical protein
MQLATVPLEALTQRVNKRLGTSYKPQTISTARNGNGGAAALVEIIRQETAAMLQEAADAAKEAR